MILYQCFKLPRLTRDRIETEQLKAGLAAKDEDALRMATKINKAVDQIASRDNKVWRCVGLRAINFVKKLIDKV